MKPIVKEITALSDDADGIAQAQAVGGAGDLTLNGALAVNGIAVLAAAQPVVVTSVGNDSGITFTITGTDADGRTASEEIQGANAGDATTAGYFLTVNQITASGAAAGNVSSGVAAANGAVTKTIRVNRNQVSSFKLGLFVQVTGTLTYTVQHSEDWPESGDYLVGGYSNQAFWRPTVGLTTLTASDEGNIAFPVETIRLLISAYTSGSAKFTVQQNY